MRFFAYAQNDGGERKKEGTRFFVLFRMTENTRKVVGWLRKSTEFFISWRQKLPRTGLGKFCLFPPLRHSLPFRYPERSEGSYSFSSVFETLKHSMKIENWKFTLSFPFGYWFLYLDYTLNMKKIALLNWCGSYLRLL